MDSNHNVFPDSDKIRELFTAIDDLNEQIASARGSYMAAAKELREQIKSVYDTANNHGINKRAFRAAYKRRELRSKMEGERVHLEELELLDELDKLEQAMTAFEATPLGRSAAKRDAA